MLNLDDIANKNHKEHNEKWLYIPNHPYRILIFRGFGLGKTNAFLNLISQQDDIDKIYLYEEKYELLIKKREDTGIKHLNDTKAFIECSNTMDNVYENVDEYNATRKIKILIVFDDMISDIMNNKNF